MSEPACAPEYPKEFYARYLFYAEADLSTAERALQPPPYWHEACFLAREAAEKSLKAFLEACGADAPPVHGLATLLRPCIAIDKEFGRFQKHCGSLARYQNDGRYPPVTSNYAFTETEAREAVRLAREILETVWARIERRKEKGLL